ncbi:hypothetical protein BCR43DRAFT_290009 [Syncephalastrum racemosum]|uniref:GRAM domain-containing protein n=1 Tax=Syncephalastrum racemosum TaxID=13706 RepID=A0A1X2HEV1_SYNRA|nr:hypothetical protein BCR43DRAFT_290009 [Syncephalastrum racemosum]
MKTYTTDNTDSHVLSPPQPIPDTKDARRPPRLKKKSWANSKWNARFHAHFRDVPKDDTLLQVYTCALQREILLQGHLFVSQHHLCFKANIFGWVTTLTLKYSDIIGIEKRMTAKIIPNAIGLATRDGLKYTFASFLTRDNAYRQLVHAWRAHVHPSRRHNINDSDSEATISFDTPGRLPQQGQQKHSLGVSTAAVDDASYPNKLCLSPSPPLSPTTIRPSSSPMPTPVVFKSSLPSTKHYSHTPQRPKTVTFAMNNTVCACNDSQGHVHYPHVGLDYTLPGKVDAVLKLLSAQDILQTSEEHGVLV